MFLISNVDRNTLIIVFSIIAFVLVAFFVTLLILYKKKKKVSYDSLLEKYEFAHNNLTCDCRNSLNRIKVLGKSDPNLYKESIRLEQQYNEILNTRDAQVNVTIQKIEKHLSLKDYKKAKELEKECVEQLDTLKKAVSTYATGINLTLMEDNNITEQCARLKIKRRELDEYFQSHIQELQPVEESFNIVLKHIDELFEKVNDSQNKALFSQAKQTIEQLSTLLKATDDVLNQLPLFVTTILKVLPRKYEQLESKYSFLTESDFDLSYTNIKARLDSLKIKIDKESEKIKSFDLHCMKDDVENIQTEISSLVDSMEDEERAKKTILENKDKKENDVYKYEKEHSAAMKTLAQIKNVYILDQQTVSNMVSLDKDIEKITILKKELESLKTSNEKKPYSLILKKDEQLEKEMDKIRTTMQDYNTYIQSLSEKCEDIYQGFRHIFQDLLVIKHNLSLFGLDKLTQSYKKVLDDIEGQLQQFFKDITAPPIDVGILLEQFTTFKTNTSQVFKVISDKIEEGKKAEAALMVANKFRIDFIDCDNILKQAESAFENGNFSLCLNLASNSIQQWNVA